MQVKAKAAEWGQAVYDASETARIHGFVESWGIDYQVVTTKVGEVQVVGSPHGPETFADVLATHNDVGSALRALLGFVLTDGEAESIEVPEGEAEPGEDFEGDYDPVAAIADNEKEVAITASGDGWAVTGDWGDGLFVVGEAPTFIEALAILVSAF